MVNHVRTLLLNLPGTPTGYSGIPGEEFIPPEFRSQFLPRPLQRLRSLLFGSDPDAAMLNYRGCQYLTLLHATELIEFVTQLDPRVTYWPFPADGLFETLFQPHVQPLASGTGALSLVGMVGPPSLVGRSRQAWRLEVTSGDQVTVIRQTPPPVHAFEDYTIQSGLSSLVPLVGSGLSARFPPGIGQAWLVEVHARPSQDLGVILANLKHGGGAALPWVFREHTAQARQEPYQTFRNLWQDHPEMPYQLGALLLAWVYRAHDQWLEGEV